MKGKSKTITMRRAQNKLKILKKLKKNLKKNEKERNFHTKKWKYFLKKFKEYAEKHEKNFVLYHDKYHYHDFLQREDYEDYVLYKYLYLKYENRVSKKRGKTQVNIRLMKKYKRRMTELFKKHKKNKVKKGLALRKMNNFLPRMRKHHRFWIYRAKYLKNYGEMMLFHWKQEHHLGQKIRFRDIRNISPYYKKMAKFHQEVYLHYHKEYVRVNKLRVQNYFKFKHLNPVVHPYTQFISSISLFYFHYYRAYNFENRYLHAKYVHKVYSVLSRKYPKNKTYRRIATMYRRIIPFYNKWFRINSQRRDMYRKLLLSTVLTHKYHKEVAKYYLDGVKIRREFAIKKMKLRFKQYNTEVKRHKFLFQKNKNHLWAKYGIPFYKNKRKSAKKYLRRNQRRFKSLSKLIKRKYKNIKLRLRFKHSLLHIRHAEQTSYHYFEKYFHGSKYRLHQAHIIQHIRNKNKSIRKISAHKRQIKKLRALIKRSKSSTGKSNLLKQIRAHLNAIKRENRNIKRLDREIKKKNQLMVKYKKLQKKALKKILEQRDLAVKNRLKALHHAHKHHEKYKGIYKKRWLHHKRLFEKYKKLYLKNPSNKKYERLMRLNWKYVKQNHARYLIHKKHSEYYLRHYKKYKKATTKKKGRILLEEETETVIKINPGFSHMHHMHMHQTSFEPKQGTMASSSGQIKENKLAHIYAENILNHLNEFNSNDRTILMKCRE